MLLVHYVGDIHQPLHVGAVYLDANGQIVNPDMGTFDPDTDTRGGNSISVKGGSTKLHALWDQIPESLTVSHVDPELLNLAKAVPVTHGQVYDWPASWAGDTLGEARQAFDGIKFGSVQNGRNIHWSATLPVDYSARMDDIKKTQLVKAGARLAQLLEAIWPPGTSIAGGSAIPK